MPLERPGEREEKESLNPDFIAVGGGPLGLAFAWGMKSLHPRLKFVVLEKYQTYQRSHTLIMQPKWLRALMEATHTQNVPKLTELLARLKKDPHIRTNELEDIFKEFSTALGVGLQIEEVKKDSIERQVVAVKPRLIIGADGTHSTVNSCLFPEGNQVKIEFDYVLQMRYEVQGDGKAAKENSISSYQRMARHGMIANEYVGAFDQDKGRTPVTMQMMISKEAFEKLKKATSKKPIQPHLSIEEKEEKAEHISELDFDKIPAEIRGFIDSYLSAKIKSNGEEEIDRRSIRYSVNEAPATYAKQPAITHNGIPALLIGDAGLGLSYFKGLNAGLEALAKFFTIWAGIIKNDEMVTKENIEKVLSEYSLWFLQEFAPRKVKEVEDYSTLSIRFPERVMRAFSAVKESSRKEDLDGDDNIIADYFRLLATDSSRKIPPKLYPHRAYDPDIKLGQFAYVPIRHTIKKIGKLFIDYFKPYKSGFHFKEDFKQPLVGVVNLSSGVIKIVAGVFTRSPKRITDGFFNLIRGALEVATTPLAWLVKPMTRGTVTYVWNKPKIEENSGIQRLAQQGLNLLRVVAPQLDESSNKAEAENIDCYRYFAIANDIHRKFNKSLKRGQRTELGLQEQLLFTELRKNKDSIQSAQFSQYFSLFSKKRQQADSSKILQVSSLTNLSAKRQ